MPQAPTGPTLAVSLEDLSFVPGSLAERIAWAQNIGFGGVELLATGEPDGVHVPSVDADDRAQLRELLQNTRLLVSAPHQQTWDVTLVSPSSAIRRASLTEIWAVCRFAGVVGKSAAGAPPIVLVRTGTPPISVGAAHVQNFLRESLSALDRTAAEHGVQIGVISRDIMQSPGDWAALTTGVSHTGLAFDAAHALDRHTPEEVAELLRRFADVLVSVRVPSGDADARPVIANALREINYQGVVSLALSEAESGHNAENAAVEACQAWAEHF